MHTNTDTDSNAVIHAWHFTNGNKLRDGRPVPPVGEWLHHEGPIVYCKKGFHASRLLLDALRYAPGSIVHSVECRYDVEEGRDKLVCRERRSTASADIEDLLHDFARFAAWTVLPLWDAPPVVKQWIETGNEKRWAVAWVVVFSAARDAAFDAVGGVDWDEDWGADWDVVWAAARNTALAAFNTLLTDAVLARLPEA